LAWLLFAVIFGVIARIRLSVIAPRESVPRRKGLKETCHLGVFLGSGKLIAVCVSHTLTPVCIVI
jgi:hypothetical protein